MSDAKLSAADRAIPNNVVVHVTHIPTEGLVHVYMLKGSDKIDCYLFPITAREMAANLIKHASAIEATQK